MRGEGVVADRLGIDCGDVGQQPHQAIRRQDAKGHVNGGERHARPMGIQQLIGRLVDLVCVFAK